jgi:N-acetylglutamate synthase-like GNAT family acetyltransferase
MGQFDLRRATLADVEAIRALVGELGYGGLDERTFAEGFRSVLGDAAQQVWVAEREGRILGLMSLTIRPQLRLAGPMVSIDEMVVTESARGSGVGGALLEIAKSEATRISARRLELHTGKRLPSYARGFYVKNGFVEVNSAVMRWEGGVSVVMR